MAEEALTLSPARGFSFAFLLTTLLQFAMRHPRNPSIHYVRNVDLAAEIALCQENYKVSDNLCRMLMKMIDRYALKPNWRRYSYIEDMKSEAILQLVKCNEHKIGMNDFRPNILKFDFTYAERSGKSPNPFAYATTIISNVFRRFIKLEKAIVNLRDDFFIDNGLSPSSGRQYEDEMNRSSEPIPSKPKGGRRGRKPKVQVTS